ncbi:MAG: hypothetical protein WCO25_03370 [Candidatus Uhrbacteria bacterium]
MNWHLLIGILAGIIQLAGTVPYVKDILRPGGTRPNVVSWSLWLVLQLVAIWIQVTSAGGISWSVLYMVATALVMGLIVVLCLRGYGSKQFGLVEKICIPLAILAIACYVMTRNGALSLVFDIAAYMVADAPTIFKTWRDPRSEAAFPWMIATIAAALGALSSTIMTPENLALPIYLVIGNGLIAAFAFFGQRRKSKSVA